MTHYSLRPETIEKISAAQTPVPPPTIEFRIKVLESIIESADKWRAYLFTVGNLASARTAAVMIGRKRHELRALKSERVLWQGLSQG